MAEDIRASQAMHTADDAAARGDGKKALELLDTQARPAIDEGLRLAASASLKTDWAKGKRDEVANVLRDRKNELPRYTEAVKSGDAEKMIAAMEAQAAIERRALAAVAGIDASQYAPLSGVRVLVIDNYDSFTWNLVQYLGELGATSRVIKNDELAASEVLATDVSGILVSPGPCTPNEAGVSLETVKRAEVPVLGVCLGHQSIGQAFGGKVVRAERLMHGRTSPIHHASTGVFAGLPSPFEATRYHSLLVERASLPDCLEVTAWTSDGEIMGLRHKERDVEGVQFHPESILTVHGKELLANWVKRLAS